MSLISKINPVDAKLDPERSFDDPTDVLTHAGMTRAQKLAAISAWRFAIEGRLKATSEGMAPEGTTDHDIRLLEQVLAVESELQKADNRKATGSQDGETG